MNDSHDILIFFNILFYIALNLVLRTSILGGGEDFSQYMESASSIILRISVSTDLKP